MAKLVACRACGNQVSTEAKACPRCGAPPKHLHVARIIAGGISTVLLVMVVVSAVGAADKATEDVRTAPRRSEPAAAPARAAAAPAPTPAPVPPAQAINVSAEQLRRDYEVNEVSADERYRGKVLLVTGLVTAVKKDVLDEPFVELSTGNQFMSVHARFAVGSDGVLREFLRGDKIVVRCVGNNVVIGSPQVKDCVLKHHYRRGDGQ
jgi:hypothetical protein